MALYCNVFTFPAYLVGKLDKSLAKAKTDYPWRLHHFPHLITYYNGSGWVVCGEGHYRISNAGYGCAHTKWGQGHNIKEALSNYLKGYIL